MDEYCVCVCVCVHVYMVCLSATCLANITAMRGMEKAH